MIPGKIPGYLGTLLVLACTPNGDGLPRGLGDDAGRQADASQDLAPEADARPDLGPEAKPDLAPDLPPDAEWNRTKPDGAPCGADRECRSGRCTNGACVRKAIGEECALNDLECASGYCDESKRPPVCGLPPCRITDCMIRPDGGGECVSTCRVGLICCPGGCRPPVDGSQDPDSGGCF